MSNVDASPGSAVMPSNFPRPNSASEAERTPVSLAWSETSVAQAFKSGARSHHPTIATKQNDVYSPDGSPASLGAQELNKAITPPRSMQPRDVLDFYLSPSSSSEKRVAVSPVERALQEHVQKRAELNRRRPTSAYGSSSRPMPSASAVDKPDWRRANSTDAAHKWNAAVDGDCDEEDIYASWRTRSPPPPRQSHSRSPSSAAAIMVDSETGGGGGYSPVLVEVSPGPSRLQPRKNSPSQRTAEGDRHPQQTQQGRPSSGGTTTIGTPHSALALSLPPRVPPRGSTVKKELVVVSYSDEDGEADEGSSDVAKTTPSSRVFSSGGKGVTSGDRTETAAADDSPPPRNLAHELEQQQQQRGRRGSGREGSPSPSPPPAEQVERMLVYHTRRSRSSSPQLSENDRFGAGALWAASGSDSSRSYSDAPLARESGDMDGEDARDSREEDTTRARADSPPVRRTSPAPSRASTTSSESQDCGAAHESSRDAASAVERGLRRAEKEDSPSPFFDRPLERHYDPFLSRAEGSPTATTKTTAAAFLTADQGAAPTENVFPPSQRASESPENYASPFSISVSPPSRSFGAREAGKEEPRFQLRDCRSTSPSPREDRGMHDKTIFVENAITATTTIVNQPSQAQLNWRNGSRSRSSSPAPAVPFTQSLSNQYPPRQPGSYHSSRTQLLQSHGHHHRNPDQAVAYTSGGAWFGNGNNSALSAGAGGVTGGDGSARLYKIPSVSMSTAMLSEASLDSFGEGSLHHRGAPQAASSADSNGTEHTTRLHPGSAFFSLTPFTAQDDARGEADSLKAPRVLCSAHIEIRPGKSELIEVHQGQTPQQAAEAFALKFRLPKNAVVAPLTQFLTLEVEKSYRRAQLRRAEAKHYHQRKQEAISREDAPIAESPLGGTDVATDGSEDTGDDDTPCGEDEWHGSGRRRNSSTLPDTALVSHGLSRSSGSTPNQRRSNSASGNGGASGKLPSSPSRTALHPNAWNTSTNPRSLSRRSRPRTVSEGAEVEVGKARVEARGTAATVTKPRGRARNMSSGSQIEEVKLNKTALLREEMGERARRQRYLEAERPLHHPVVAPYTQRMWEGGGSEAAGKKVFERLSGRNGSSGATADAVAGGFAERGPLKSPDPRTNDPVTAPTSGDAEKPRRSRSSKTAPRHSGSGGSSVGVAKGGEVGTNTPMSALEASALERCERLYADAKKREEKLETMRAEALQRRLAEEEQALRRPPTSRIRSVPRQRQKQTVHSDGTANGESKIVAASTISHITAFSDITNSRPSSKTKTRTGKVSKLPLPAKDIVPQQRSASSDAKPTSRSTSVTGRRSRGTVKTPKSLSEHQTAPPQALPKAAFTRRKKSTDAAQLMPADNTRDTQYQRQRSVHFEGDKIRKKKKHTLETAPQKQQASPPTLTISPDGRSKPHLSSPSSHYGPTNHNSAGSTNLSPFSRDCAWNSSGSRTAAEMSGNSAGGDGSSLTPQRLQSAMDNAAYSPFSTQGSRSGSRDNSTSQSRHRLHLSPPPPLPERQPQPRAQSKVGQRVEERLWQLEVERLSRLEEQRLQKNTIDTDTGRPLFTPFLGR